MKTNFFGLLAAVVCSLGVSSDPALAQQPGEAASVTKLVVPAPARLLACWRRSCLRTGSIQ